MTEALLAALLSCAAPARAAAPAPVPAPPAQNQPGDPVVPDADRQPNPGSDGGVTPYALKDFDAVIKADQARMEANLKMTLKQIDTQFETQRDLETRQLKAKFEFLKKLRDERAAFERAEIEDWKKFAAALRSVEPAERGTEKLQYDQKDMERRRKRDDAVMAQNKEFLEKQQRERDQYWIGVQKENDESSRRQQEHATEWGKAPPAAP